jgi:hypothetical protein
VWRERRTVATRTGCRHKGGECEGKREWILHGGAANPEYASDYSVFRIMFFFLILPVALGPGVYSASNRNEYQKHKNVSGE